MRQIGLTLLIVAGLASQVWSSDTATPILGQKVAEFTLKDARGKPYSLSQFATKPIVVLAVLGTECPLAKQYAIKLQKLAEQYEDRGVVVLALDANRQDSLVEIAAFAKTNSLTFPILKDLNQQVADAIGATRTPEVVVLDAQRVVRYRGRVDDQFAVGGKSRKVATRDDLKIALDELLSGKVVSVPETSAIGCLIGRAREAKNDATVTYSNQVARVLQKHCVECHRPGEIAPFSLTDYQEVAGWADMMVEVTRSQQMPPWHASPEFGHFANERRMAPEELQILQDWAAAGAPEGNPADLPAPKTYTEGWQLPRQPDHVVWMSDKTFKVPDTGTVKYQYFAVDAGFAEDKWVTAAEVIPGNRAVVHHVIVFMSTDDKVSDEERQFVTAYVPGLRVTPLPKGMAKRVPKGAKFIFQMHYTPNGVATEDRSQVGLIFADSADIQYEVKTAVNVNRRFKIQPQLDNQAFDSREVTFPIDVKLLSLSPHMHLRGKSFRYELTLPDGTTETLLDVPHYDFNWQTGYRLSEPRTLPKGAKIKSFAAFDNSPNNLANPDPSKTVTWGEQSWDEMLLGYFDIAIDRKTSDAMAQTAASGSKPRDPQEVVKRVLQAVDKNKDGKVTRDEIGPTQKPLFDKLDTDKNDIVTREEILKGLPELMKLFPLQL
ncbi:redoxin domain-containing protein [Schlesneria paludicola]|uniref:redoxin domain-containing protein n=1 Tax=Schlesneria paludicola TaxID=360056 RepID=UPI00029ABDC8|nr:redoxin domain-containing protein [Schlesneria paludicola]